MGLFGKLLGKEGPKPQEAQEAQKPTEGKEVKTATETGRERVEKIIDAAKALWAGLRGLLSSGLERAKNGTMEAIFAAVGGAEKGAEAGMRGTKAGVKGAKAAGRYTSESAREAGELAVLGVEIGVRAGAVALQEMGVNAAEAVRTFRVEKLAQASEAAKRAKDFGLDLTVSGAVAILESVMALEQRGVNLKDSVQAKGREYIQKGADIYGRAKEGAREIALAGKEAYNRMIGRVGTARDKFYARINEKRLQLAGTAELKGEVAALREQVARLTRLMETQTALSPVEPENMVWKEVDKEAETTQRMATTR